jgi:hypothetical protein
MTNKETKLDLIYALANRGVYFKQVNDVEYRTRCPFCGDSDKEYTGHLYIRINPDDNFNPVFHCFKCEESGILNAENLSTFDIDDIDLKSKLAILNKTAKKMDSKNISDGSRNRYFDYKLPEIKRGTKTKYIENRLGLSFNDEQFKRMKIITSLKDFLILNGIKKITCKNQMAFMLEDHYVGFLSFGNSHILFRDITGKEKIKWIKYPITEESKENRLFYSMEASIDVLSTEPMTINLSEGVLDTLSACYNLGFDDSNTMHISVSGKYYDRLLLYLIDLGLVGSNITVNIFSDNDEMYNKKNNNPTTVEYYGKLLKNYKHLYGQVNVYYNLAGKDIGVPRQEISLKKYLL